VLHSPENDLLTERIIGFAVEVHRRLGPGLLESAYEECLYFELQTAAINFKRQVSLPVVYKSVRLDCDYRLDFVVELKGWNSTNAVGEASIVLRVAILIRPRKHTAALFTGGRR